jgi:hypothetical protein
MKTFSIVTILFLLISFNYESSAMGFPHNLLAGKKGEKKEKTVRSNVQNFQKKVIIMKDSRFYNVGEKILMYFLKRQD